MCFISCKHSESMKSESVDMEFEATEAMEDVIGNEFNTLEKLGSQKIIEYFDLIKLKQKHPEFESDINTQLQSFTDTSNLNYPDGFTISNIKQIGETNVISDSITNFKLGYDVISETKSFKDSLLVEIKSKVVYIKDKREVSQKVRFISYN